MGIQIGNPCLGNSLGPYTWVSNHLRVFPGKTTVAFRGLCPCLCEVAGRATLFPQTSYGPT